MDHDPVAIASQLERYATRLRASSIYRAIELWQIWQSYNETNNPLRDAQLPRDECARAINLLAQSALHETIVIVTRAFDSSGHKGALKSNRISFPVMRELADLPGVQEELEQRARTWLHEGFLADENEESVRAALARLRGRLDELATETPNRLRRMRDFRDEFLAHNLEFSAEREKPIIGDVTGLLEEAKFLANQASMAFGGSDVVWEGILAEKSAARLWEVVRRGTAQNVG